MAPSRDKAKHRLLQHLPAGYRGLPRKGIAFTYAPGGKLEFTLLGKGFMSFIKEGHEEVMSTDNLLENVLGKLKWRKIIVSKNNKPRINALPALLLLSATVGATLSGSVAAAERDLRSDSRAEMDRRKTELAKEEGTSLAQADTEEVAPKGDGATGMKGETTTSLSLRR